MSEKIIEGLYFHYTTEQLASHMQQRAQHHDNRASQKEKAIPGLKEAIETVRKTTEATVAAQMSKMASNSYHFRGSDELEALENDIRDHKNKAIVFRELSGHLVANVTYQLGESDLRRLEIVK